MRRNADPAGRGADLDRFKLIILLCVLDNRKRSRIFCGMANVRLIKLKWNLPGGRQAQVERIEWIRADFLVG